jgi:hypothetical protein
MSQQTEVVVFYAVVPKAEAHKVRLPEGTFAKVFNAEVEDFHDKNHCKKFGHIFMESLNRLAKKLSPETNVIARL